MIAVEQIHSNILLASWYKQPRNTLSLKLYLCVLKKPSVYFRLVALSNHCSNPGKSGDAYHPGMNSVV